MSKYTLRYSRAQLLYDIQNYAYIEGDTLGDEGGELTHKIQDVCEDGNADRVERVIELGVAKACDLLYPYVKQEAQGGVIDNAPDGKDEYTIELELREGTSRTSVNLLSKVLHEYIVCRVLADWLSIVRPDKAGVWAAKAAEAESEVRMSLNWRMGELRRRPWPL